MNPRKIVDPELPGRYGRMTAEELDREVARFDRDILIDETRPLTPAQKRLHEKVRRQGRPRIGKGAKRVLVTIEGGLLEETDRLARQQDISRSQIIARGLRAVLRGAA